MRDEDFAAVRAWMSGFNEGDPVLGRVAAALGTSQLRVPDGTEGVPGLGRFTFDANAAGRPVSVQVLALGRPDTDHARIEAARDRIALVQEIESAHVVEVLSAVMVLEGYPGALCWLEEPTLPDSLVDDGQDSEAPWSVDKAGALLGGLGAGVAAFHARGARAWPRLGGIGQRSTGEFAVTNGNFVFALRAASDAGHPVLDLVPFFDSPDDGRGGPVSLVGDVYTLGVLTYLVLTGHPPVEAGSASAELRASTSEDAAEYVANLPSRGFLPVQVARPEVPDHLAAVIERCLRPVEEGRYPDAAAMLADMTE